MNLWIETCSVIHLFFVNKSNSLKFTTKYNMLVYGYKLKWKHTVLIQFWNYYLVVLLTQVVVLVFWVVVIVVVAVLVLAHN